MSYSPRACPISWSSARYGYCLGHVKPSDDRGMYVNLRNNLAPRLREVQPRYEESTKFHAYVKLLERQRLMIKTYTGEIFPGNPSAHAQVAREVGDRLHRSMNIYQPAESRDRPIRRYCGDDFSLKKPVYSRDEVLRILNKLAVHGSDSADPERDKRMEEIRRRFRKTQLYYPASCVREAISDYLGIKGVSGNGIHRPLSARSRAHSPIFREIARDVKESERKHPPDDVMETTKRLHNAEVGGQGRPRRCQSAPVERSRSRKVTEQELQEIIDRLSKYDDRKWPPESKDPKQLHVYK